MSPSTLIQLISERTIQNLLPVLRLKPFRIIHLVTPKTATRSAGLQAAAKAAGLSPKLDQFLRRHQAHEHRSICRRANS